MPMPALCRNFHPGCSEAVAASSLSLQAGMQASTVTSNALVWADPVADVLDWLGRYDFRDDYSTSSTNAPADNSEEEICDEARQDEGPREEAEGSILKEAVRAQAPKQTSSPMREPGRLLHPKGAASSRQDKSCASGKAACLNNSTAKGSCCSAAGEKRSGRDFFEEEEEEWDQRQQKSGTVGRLVVYHEGESPREDVVLRGGGLRRIVVAGVREGGQAARVGVRAGDRLVSINGKKDFLGLTADSVREKLEAPTVLVFLGFVGKLQAEVRLTCGDHVCGISSRQEVVRGSDDAPLRLCEERIFNAGIASLFLTVGLPGEDEAEVEVEKTFYNLDKADCAKLPFFELQQLEAHFLLKRALRRLEVKELAQGAVARTAWGGTR